MKPPHNHRPGRPDGPRPPPGAAPTRGHEGQSRGRPGPQGRQQSDDGSAAAIHRGPRQSDPDRPWHGQRPSGANPGARNRPGGFGQPRSQHHEHDQSSGQPSQRRPRPEGSRPEGSRTDGQRHGGPQHVHHGPRPPDAPRGTLWLYGQHAVAAALANPARRLRRLLATEEAELLLAQRLPQPWPVPPERAERGRLDQLLGRDVAHQGLALLADPLPAPSLAQALDRTGPIVVLDQVTDPRNVGAILRTAAAFGAAAVITQDRNAPEETGALAKAASGALETIPLLRAVNIARTLIALKAANLWTVGLDGGGTPLAGPALADRRIALVLGAEGSGLRRLTRETCDEIAGLATRRAMETLNVSAAAAVALYELTRRA